MLRWSAGSFLARCDGPGPERGHGCMREEKDASEDAAESCWLGAGELVMAVYCQRRSGYGRFPGAAEYAGAGR